MAKEKEIQNGHFRPIVALIQRGDFLALETSQRSSYIFQSGKLIESSWDLHTMGSIYSTELFHFHLKTMPGVFTKILVSLETHLRTQRVPIFPYLNNFLIKAPTLQQGMENVSQTVPCLKKHGFKWKKNNLPLQIVLHLGAITDATWDRGRKTDRIR